MPDPIRVTVIGGGCGAMSAAFELSRPEHGGKYAVTVYQMGWRLGGKGASGRGIHGRIEEHGLHVWLGHYENAFRMMRECHAELDRTCPEHNYGDWRDAFMPEPDIGLFNKSAEGTWKTWSTRFPPRRGLPGDPIEPDDRPSLAGYLRGALTLAAMLVFETEAMPPPALPAATTDDAGRLSDLLFAMLGRGVFAGAIAVAEACVLLGAAIGRLPHSGNNLLLDFAAKLAMAVRRQLEDRRLAADDQHLIWEVIDVTLASCIGILRAGLLDDPRGLDALDEFEMAEWLVASGASPRSANSAYVRGLYDLGFAHENGDAARPRFAAGTGLRGSMRMFFGYRGAVFWRMRAGMGDVVFAPLYDLLRARGVKFEFFHRLTNVGLDAARSHVATLDFEVQAKGWNGDYRPLVEVAGRRCWPSEPQLDQLVDGAAFAGIDFESHWERPCVEHYRIAVVKDFDFVVLGTSVGAFPHVAAELVAHDRRWRDMVAHVGTTATQAFQIWLDTDVQALGWTCPAHIVTAFDKPFETWCDMAHVIPEENWPVRPATAIYFCSVLADPPVTPADSDTNYPARRDAEVRATAELYLATAARAFWPAAYDAAGFKWQMLAAPGLSASGQARFGTQYWRANVNPSDRYVLSLPGSTQYRISPLERIYDNFTIAGDWTSCGINSGCTEAAVISGRLAAHALTGLPRIEDIVGYDHP